MKKYFSFKFSFLFSTLLLILISESGFAQLAVPFKVRYQSHVKGDMTIIANTIVNRTESKNATSEPYNDISEKAKLNDEFEMAYIDIDNDETTFSSSSAQLNLTTSTTKKVIYAGLYWSALYKSLLLDVAVKAVIWLRIGSETVLEAMDVATTSILILLTLLLQPVEADTPT